MKKLVAVFLLAVLIPSLILAWLAVRSLRDQELIVERQRALLHQSTTDALAGDVNVFMDDIRVYFHNVVDELLAERGIEAVSNEFDAMIRDRWAQVEVGAVVGEDGQLVSPGGDSKEPRLQAFWFGNEDFLTNSKTEEVYLAAPPVMNTIAVDLEEESEGRRAAPSSSKDERGWSFGSRGDQPAYKEKVSVDSSKLRSRLPEKKQEVAISQQTAAAEDLKERNIAPQSLDYGPQPADNEAPFEAANANPWSTLVTQRGEFRELMGDDEEGAFSRFLQNRLHILLWYRPAESRGRVFCAQLDLAMLREEVGKIIGEFQPGRTKEICLALLDETGKAIRTNVPGFQTNWGNPFVATEVGEILPHWEVAAYLTNPGALNQAARSFQFTLGLMIFVLIGAIGLGSILIFLDLARQTKLARQKTDFVSNVSHELKTPLTSIRMFSDLLSGDAAAAGEKRREYAGIISSEAARLTRLINNVLDFSRLERGDKEYEFQRLDLESLVKETVDHYRDHLRARGVSVSFEAGANGGIEIEGDHDALSQVLLNLITNAEKYGGSGKEIAVAVKRVDGVAEVTVMDRGDGVDRKHQDRIFQKFYRADDSLSSGIQGSGLGLTLARQIARAHGGDVVYRNREGGGSCFVIVVPAVDSETGVPPVD